MGEYRNPAVKTAIDKRYHKLGLGYRRPVFKKTAIGMDINYWDDNIIKTARIVALVRPDYGEDQWALLDNGKRIDVSALVGVY